MTKEDRSYLYDNFLHKCRVCGKIFYVPCTELWAYKRKSHSRKTQSTDYKWFCSWHCISEYDKTQKKMTAGRFATQKC